MRLKVISLFLAVQFMSFALWQGTLARDQKSAEPIVVSTEDVLAINHEAAKPHLNQIRFAAKTMDNVYGELDQKQKTGLSEVIAKLPEKHTSSLKNVILDYNPNAHRGLGGKSLIILRGINMGNQELSSVLIHEIGHSVDLGVLSEEDQSKASEFKDGKSQVYEGDLSLEFYRLCWGNEMTRKKTVGNFDFVSGYAMSDPFEDFAETYVYYVLHNQDFKSKTQTSDILFQKYEFMKNKIFNGKEFATGEYKPEDLNRRPWDVTVLSYDLDTFLNS